MALGNSRFGEWANGPLNLGDGSVTDISPSGKNGGNYRSFFGSSPGGGGVAFDPSALDSSFNSQPGTGANLGAGLSFGGSGGGGGGGGGGGMRPWGSLSDHRGDKGPGTGPGYMSSGPGGSGGGYGIGGQGPGGFNQSAGLGFFDDGGEVGGDYSGGNASQVDPMQIVKGALAYGRQKMGLPAVFHDDPEQQNGSMEQQGFDDGGPVLDEGGGQEQGQQPIDPRSTIQYLTGTGQLSPEVAEALEQQVDPEGTMDPAQRKLMAIAQAPTQDAKFGLMQHYRTRYNAHSGAARAALDQGNLGAAAQHAMQAFHNVPTGMSVKFAPAGRGLAMHATKAGQQQGFDQGGSVDVTNPSVLMKQQEKGFEDGGEVDEEEQEDTREDPPTSDSVDDRRDVDEIDPMTRGTAADRQKMTTRSDNMADFGILRDEMSGSGRMKKQTAYDDGGGVLEEENPEEVLADEAPADETPEDSQPTVLTPEQVKAALGPGTYDEALDRGWPAWFKKIMSQGASNLNPVGAAEAGETRSPLLNPKQYFKDKGLFGMSNSPAEEVEKRFPDEGEMPAPVAPQPVRPQPPEPQAPAPRTPAPPQQPFGSSTMELQGAPEKSAAREKPAEEADPDKDIMRRLNRVANQLFPSVGQQDQRSAYIAHMYEKYQDQASKERINERTVEGKKTVAETGGQTKSTLQSQKDNAAMERALLSRDRHLMQTAANNATKLYTADQNAKLRQHGQLLMANPELLKDPQKLNAMLKADSAAIGLSPPAAAQLAVMMAQGGGGGSQAPAPGGQQQQTPAPKVGNPNAAKVGEERPVRNPESGTNETWYFGKDGNWHKKH